MKKLLIVLPLVVLLAAACSQKQPPEAINSTPASTQKQPIKQVGDSPTQQQSNTTQTQNNIKATNNANWKTYKNTTYKFEFKYNPTWSLSQINKGSGYNSSQPYILIWAGTVSDKPCLDLGCPPKSGDRDEFTKGDTSEGETPAHPWFKMLSVRGNLWVSIQLTDVNKNCTTQTICQQYLAAVPFIQKTKVTSSDYHTYNDFIDLISTFKFTK